MDGLSSFYENQKKLEARIGYTFLDPKLLLNAFIHRSFVNEYRRAGIEHNERLEFLGDSVLGLIVAKALYEKLPEEPEGVLSKLRSRLVDAIACVQYLEKLDLENYILVGRGELIHQKKMRASILADVFEALLGAIYLDGGFAAAESFFWNHFEKEFQETIATPARNYKADLQDFSQKQWQELPVYEVVSEEGPDHAKEFEVIVLLHGEKSGTGKGLSKKEAEQMAAKDALFRRGL